MTAAPAVGGDRLDRPRELTASSCTTVKYGGQARVLYRRGVSCAFAKRWINRMARSRGRSMPAGYRCSSGSAYRSGGYCERGNRHFGWHTSD